MYCSTECDALRICYRISLFQKKHCSARFMHVVEPESSRRTLLFIWQVVVHFWASWYEPCQALDAALAQLERECTDLGVVRVEAEVVPDVSEAMEVAAVPLCLLYSQGEKRVGLEGADVAALSAAVLELVQSGAKTNGAEEVTRDAGVDSSTTQRDTLRARLQALVRQAPIMLFMKGSPAEPRCGFSRRVVEALNAAGVKFGHFDILGDDDVRQGLKELSNWPTFPQLYAAGELVGGCDIVLELAASGQLQEELRAAMLAGGDPKQILEARIKALLAQAPVMLFMKGAGGVDRTARMCMFKAVNEETRGLTPELEISC